MIWCILFSTLISLPGAHASVLIGANMDGLADWSRSHPYVNLIRQARVWGSPSTPWDGAVTFDRTTGWPNQDFGVVLATENLDLGGAYILSARGNATVSTTGGSTAYITDQTYDASTNTLTAVVHVPEGIDQMMLAFRNTTGPGLEDITLLQPEYNLTDKNNISTLMLAHLSRFNLVRFMDWTDTNDNFEKNWNDTTPLAWPQYTSPKRNPWQTIPYIANQLNQSIDVWINIPHNASDDYILNVARIMLNELNSNNNIYVEYSNEVWNFAFPQAQANHLAAIDSVQNHGDPYQLNYDHVGDSFTWGFRRTAYAIKHISDLFKTVFGNDNVGPWKRVRPILAGQAVNSYIITTGLDYVNTVYGPPSNFFHGIAIAPYFDLGDSKSRSDLTVDEVLDALNSSIDQFLPSQGWNEKSFIGLHAVYAAWYKLGVYGYEGGPDTAAGCGECSLDAKINATRHPRMTDVCLKYLNGWYEYGFEILNWFASGANAITKYGSWSILEDMREETLIDTTTMFNATSPVAQLPRPSPKLKAIDEFRESSIELNFGFSIPALNLNATNFAGHRVPYPDPDLRNLGANSTFYYPIQILQSPIQLNITVYVAGNSGILEGGINNEQFIEVETPSTANTTTFQSSPSMLFQIDQRIVPSIVTFRLRNLQNGYSISCFDIAVMKIKTISGLVSS